jgi:hypothetical protein
MAYSIPNGLAISLDGNTFYALTDHNRKQIDIVPTLIEKSARMANGTMRKYVIANKKTFSASWEMVPAQASQCVDYSQHSGGPTVVSSAWLDAFYRANVGLPLKLRVYTSADTSISIGNIPNESTYQTSRVSYTDYNVFITKYTNNVTHRNVYTDYVNMDIEFTEI